MDGASLTLDASLRVGLLASVSLSDRGVHDSASSSSTSAVKSGDALELLGQGVAFAEQQRFGDALAQFCAVLRALKDRSALLTNRAQSHSKLASPSSADARLLNATAAVALDPSPKARLR